MKQSFQRTDGCEEWLTPPNLLAKLGAFDLDPCSPANRPWDTAMMHYMKDDDGLKEHWNGRVFCNPPYGSKTKLWLKKCSEHGNAIALVFARVETRMFFDFVWGKSDGVLFLRGRLRFFHADGKSAANSAGAPSCLIAYGFYNAQLLESLSPELGAWCGRKQKI